jgi:hypothetical protein
MMTKEIKERDCYIIHDTISNLYVYDFRNECSRGFSCFVSREEATVFSEYPSHLEPRCKYHAEREDRSLRIIHWRERVTVETETLSEPFVINCFS